MILYIAEKPSLARAIADVLPKPHKKGEGFILTADGDMVSWCIGHLLEQAPPDHYHSRYKSWQIADLPIIPERWLLIPKLSTQKQLMILLSLIKKADTIYHVGDPDREGQLLIDEVLNYSQLPDEKRKQIKRCLISDLNAEAVKKALSQPQNNRDYASLSTSALARARADWLYGINMSRLCTLKGQNKGYRGVLSVGRVQTPLLGLIVRRDLEIEQFKPHAFYEVYADVITEKGEAFCAKWQPSEHCAPYQDEEGRVLLKSLAQNVVDRIVHQQGEVVSATNKKREVAPPLPLNLSALQIEMAKKHQLSAQQVLDGCQSLYEKHKLITYPRSDCRYLPHAHLAQVRSLQSVIAHNCPELVTYIEQSNTDLQSTAWDDKKVGAHHAIIPTARKQNLASLSNIERQIYTMVVLYYIVQFFPKYRFTEQQVTLNLCDGCFIAKTTQLIDYGWKSLLQKRDLQEKDKEVSQLLGSLNKGDVLICQGAELREKETSAPLAFTDATLLSAMTGIARFVKDPSIRKILRDTDGLGTEATRAGIIELLFKREFLVRKGRYIQSTLAARQLILQLPDVTTTPDLTALWESQLEAIYLKQQSYQIFISELTQFLTQLIVEVTHLDFKPFVSMSKHT